MPTTARNRRLLLGGLTLLLTAAATTVSSATADPNPSRPNREYAPVRPVGDRPGALTPAQRHVIREATVQYLDVDAAIAAGYQPTDVCVEEPGLGGMGYHYAHPRYAADAVVDPTLPEILVYVPGHHGHLRLGAIEYFKADADGDLETDEDRPTLFGEPFDGPMEGHEPGQPVHYDLHAWLWKPNPAGELAQFNPRVHCPVRSG